MQLLPLALLAPAIAVLAGTVAALMLDAFDRRAASLIAVAVSLVTAGVLGPMLDVVSPSESKLFFATGGTITLGALGYLLAAAAVASGSRTFMRRDRGAAMAALMALGAVFAQTLLASADLSVLFVSLVGLAVVAYALIAGSGTRPAEESAMRYFVQGTVASGLTVFGLALVLGLGRGVTGYAPGLSELGVEQLRPALLAMGLVISALGFKIGAFPFHSWVPDAYQHADAPVAAYLGAVPKLAGVVALVVLARGTLFGAVGGRALPAILVVMSVASLLFGAFGMLRQRSVARLLGYSAIAQIGYALLALAGGEGGADAAVIHVALYAVAACAAFVGIEAISRMRPGWDGTLDSLAGFSRQAPLASASLAVVLLSLTGIPLFGGFWGKLYTLTAALDGGLVWPTIVAAGAAVVSFGGYGSVLRHLFFEAKDASDDEYSEDAAAAHAEAREGGIASAVLVMLAAVLLAAGLAPLVHTQILHTLFGL